MSLECPVCRARNEQDPRCRRCRADLGLLFAVRAEHEAAARRARAHLAHGRVVEARAAAEKALALQRDEAGRRLAAVGRLLARDFGGAWQAYRASS